MRIYALLLAIALTTGYGYAAQLAVSSVGSSRRAPAEPAATTPPGHATGELWYGGVLDPVTVESERGGGQAVAGKHGVVSRHTLRCTDAAQSSFRAIS
jgi:hypothetical protein